MAEVLQIIPAAPGRLQVRFVVCSEGYAAGQRDKFTADATALFRAVVDQSFWADLAGCWFLTAVWKPGSPFAASFQTVGNGAAIRTNRPAVLNTLNALGFLSENPAAESVVLVNDGRYGGSGSSYYVTVSLHSNSANIARHEMAHGFAGLDDEYDIGGGVNQFVAANGSVNLSADGNPATVKWSPLIRAGRLGAPVEGEGGGWFRPRSNCKMRNPDDEFCPVCANALRAELKNRCGIVDAVHLPWPPWPPQPVGLSVSRLQLAA